MSADGAAPEAPRARAIVARIIGARVIAVLLVLSALSSIVQIPENLPWEADVVPMIGLFHVLAGVSGVVAGVGAWQRTRWAPYAVVAWAAINIAFVFSLGPLLDLPAEATKDFPIGAAAIGLLAGGMAWFLSRSRA
ncbi:MAG: hypothetical protein K8S21_06275 [Gemmatimonadetes bacterium]|nr:hypothetical protein [Gemmatimonadota bacterium]